MKFSFFFFLIWIFESCSDWVRRLQEESTQQPRRRGDKRCIEPIRSQAAEMKTIIAKDADDKPHSLCDEPLLTLNSWEMSPISMLHENSIEYKSRVKWLWSPRKSWAKEEKKTQPCGFYF